MTKKFKKPLYMRDGVLTAPGHGPVPIRGVYASEDNKQIQFEGRIDPTETWTISKLNIFPRSGTMYFRSKGVEYTVRELRDNDGIWLSKYGILLPEDALSALIEIGGQVDLNEQLVAVATDDSPYVVGLLYRNANGTYARQDGQWVKVAENDHTYDSMVPMHIDPSRSKDFVVLYDENYVSVSDAQEFEAADSKDGSLPEDRPAEED